MQNASLAMFPSLSCTVYPIAGDNRRECHGIYEMDEINAELAMLRLRMAGIGTQLDGIWSKTLDAQRHLDIDADERAYWHAGYHQALSDVIGLLTRAQASDDNSDTSNRFHLAG
jgi:hypothetical protein